MELEHIFYWSNLPYNIELRWTIAEEQGWVIDTDKRKEPWVETFVC